MTDVNQVEGPDHLGRYAAEYMEAREGIPSGLDLEPITSRRRKALLRLMRGTRRDWDNWKWQLAHSLSEPHQLRQVLDLEPARLESLERVSQHFRWALSPYYASLMDPDDPSCPIYQQSIPRSEELTDDFGVDDPMAEEKSSPVAAVTRRYPDRVIIKATNRCAMFCRHCQRRRNIGDTDTATPSEELEKAFHYVAGRPEIRDVLVTGGDPLTLSDGRLDWILGKLDRIPHVEIKRIGSRTPVTLPQRITSDLCQVLSDHHPVFLNTQFNHPREVTEEARKACDALSRAGVPLGNQAVLLRGINDSVHVMKRLHHLLLQIRVRPYYLFHAKAVRGTSHFITPVEAGLDIVEKFRGHTSGLAIPTYVVNAPGGQGKVPLMPDYLFSRFGRRHVAMRNWRNRLFLYPNTQGRGGGEEA